MAEHAGLGFSGRVAAAFLTTEITPLLALLGVLAGVFAVLVTPREEEPQINVTFANVFIPFPGASAAEVESLVTVPAEQVLSEITGVKHIYSVSRPGMSIVTVRFRVGENRTDAIVRLYNQVFSNQDWFPEALGVGRPLVKPKGIDDVPVVTVTLWSKDPTTGAYELSQVAHALEAELKKVPGTRDIYTVGAPDQVVHVFLDAQKLAGYGIDARDLRRSLAAGNVSVDGGSLVAENRELSIKAGVFLADTHEIGDLVVGTHDASPVYLSDVATVRHAPYQPERYVQFALLGDGGGERHAAVTVGIAKQPGRNAVDIAKRIRKRIEDLKGLVIPSGVEVTITRDYGRTADAKARTLIQKLLFATTSVVLLVLLTMGWREAIIVGAAVLVTLAITLFASWAWGFTLNRVSLFALIFSIGILVDDAIVVVENIHRHISEGAGSLVEAIPRAVDEVGGPTILATFTVIAALLPMAFVSGLMGPYMSPIPINASSGMLISLAVAFVLTPWMGRKLLGASTSGHAPAGPRDEGGLYALFDRLLTPFLSVRQGALRRRLLGATLIFLIAASLSLVAFQWVVLKMLPFDDKSELQVLVDLDEGTSLEQTVRVLNAVGQTLSAVPEVANYQSYAGTTAPIGFNGLVRQYYLREESHQGDVQVNLVEKSARNRKSHEIALEIRELLEPVASRFRAKLKIVEVPPGPPVLAPLVAEVYGLDYGAQVEAARRLHELFISTPGIVDVDDTIEYPAERLIFRVDRQRAAQFGVSQAEVAQTLVLLTAGEDVSFLRASRLKYAVPIRLELSVADKADIDNLLTFKLRASDGRMVPLSEFVRMDTETRDSAIHHKDLRPVVYVTGDMAGHLDSPLYGMFELYKHIAEGMPPLDQYLVRPAETSVNTSLKWNGEWQVTYDTFRDMGIAYAVGIVLIYLLVVAQFRSYLVPLIIMAPIPLTVIGVMPGHALLGAKFTATSMIGMIALAGIIVRNSILLVDFVNEQVRSGSTLDQAVVHSGAVRAKPIVLTALAAMLGAFFILDDPIFNGLAVTLICGIFVSTLLTLIVIPVMYYAFTYKHVNRITGKSGIGHASE